MYPCTKFQLIWKTSNFGTKFASKKYEWQKIWKNKRWNRNKHIAVYPCTKFWLSWRTSDFRTKFAQKSMNDKNFEKQTLNMKLTYSNVRLYQIWVNLENFSF